MTIKQISSGNNDQNNLFGDFGRYNIITSWKSWPDIFNPFPSLPSKMEIGQFQSLDIVLNNKTGLLFLEII